MTAHPVAVRPDPPADRHTLSELLLDGGIRSVYQPIVDLYSGTTVAFEAFARGPEGHPLATPDRLFAAAARDGLTAELDRACRRSAVRGARTARLGRPHSLFLNVEPVALTGRDRTDLGDIGIAATGDATRFIEITERDVASDPVALLRFVAAARERGMGIALDDVGAEVESLAMLPLVRPDVIKLDLRLVQDRPDRHVADVFSAVNAEVERSGSVLLAEGIETEQHRDVALGWGARLGQGWLFGRPGPLPRRADGETDAGTAPLVPRASPAGFDLAAAPFDLVAGRGTVRTLAKPLLLELSHHLERRAKEGDGNALVVSTLQHARFLTPATSRRYRRLAGTCAFVALLGEDLASEPVAGVRGGRLLPSDPVRGEWDVVVLGAQYAAALVARDRGDDGPDERRRFDYVLTHDRDTVTAVAAALLARCGRAYASPSATSGDSTQSAR
ncbi:sensor domain-containing phosphodiesterase [Jatrophihabitans fulvus]